MLFEHLISFFTSTSVYELKVNEAEIYFPRYTQLISNFIRPNETENAVCCRKWGAIPNTNTSWTICEEKKNPEITFPQIMLPHFLRIIIHHNIHDMIADERIITFSISHRLLIFHDLCIFMRFLEKNNGVDLETMEQWDFIVGGN